MNHSRRKNKLTDRQRLEAALRRSDVIISPEARNALTTALKQADGFTICSPYSSPPMSTSGIENMRAEGHVVVLDEKDWKTLFAKSLEKEPLHVFAPPVFRIDAP